MSRSKIDKAIYDKERYDKLREQGVSEGRAKRVSTVPLRHDKSPSRPTEDEAPFSQEGVVERSGRDDRPVKGSKVSTTNPRTGI